jgi:response regulator RpfG family c-di-GMP phosphodiesterase
MKMENSPEIVFAADQSNIAAPSESWKILIADDEEDVHAVTRMVLEDFEFKGRKLEFYNAYSGQEALQVLEQNPDIAVVFLDVVMETEHAGLDAVKRIRNELCNRFVRIILRTGQPGQAPEKSVVVDYDINDYKEKTELTSKKLYTCLVSALRSYLDIQSIEKNRRGLFKILESVSVFDFNSIAGYASGLLTQFSALLDIDENEIVIVRRSNPQGGMDIVAAAGRREQMNGKDIAQALHEPDICRIQKAFQDASSSYDQEGAAYYFNMMPHGEAVVALFRHKVLDEVDIALAEIFSQKILLAINNIERLNRMYDDRLSGVFGMAMLAEPAALITRAELQRMRQLCKRLSLHLMHSYTFEQQIDDEFIEQIEIACVLHDVGNIRMPAELLLKPGKLSTAETSELAQHTLQGAEILGRMSDNNGYLAMSCTIAAAHHEQFNGRGYPAGMNGERIPLAARIVAVVDSYVAMTSPRPYRCALAPELALLEIAQASGERFDPRIVEALLACAADFEQE